MAALKCHAVASHANGRIPGMTQSHNCRFQAKYRVFEAGVAYPICGVHRAAMMDRYVPGRGKVHSYGISVVGDRDDRNAKHLHLLPYEEHAVELLVVTE